MEHNYLTTTSTTSSTSSTINFTLLDVAFDGLILSTATCLSIILRCMIYCEYSYTLCYNISILLVLLCRIPMYLNCIPLLCMSRVLLYSVYIIINDLPIRTMFFAYLTYVCILHTDIIYIAESNKISRIQYKNILLLYLILYTLQLHVYLFFALILQPFPSLRHMYNIYDINHTSIYNPLSHPCYIV